MLRVAVTTVLLFVVSSCADGDAASEPEDTATVGEEGLTVTRDGGETYEFHDAVAECATSDAGAGDIEVVRLTAPADYRHAFRKGRLREPFLYVEVIPGIEGRREFPLGGRNFDEGPPDVVVFGADPEGQNELSGDVEVATGHVTIIEATCDPEPRVAFTIRATLGSEFSDGRSVHVWGGLEAGESPG